ncbi:MAG: metallophosphoesterase family protein, partial [Holophagales bacterium]|nr:metallophosphoesterase family protein [Holophagales bacterium]
MISPDLGSSEPTVQTASRNHRHLRLVRNLTLPPVVAIALAGCAGELPDPPSGAASVLVPSGAEWRYLDDGSDPGDAWTAPDFDDSAWLAGPAALGYGRGDELTVLRCRVGTEPGTGCPEGEPNRFMAAFFRHAFELEDPAAFDRFRLRLKKDDGAVVYLNGRELARSNLRPGFEGQGHPAGSVTDQPRAWLEYRLEPGVAAAGRNVLAVEVHSAGPEDENLGFDLELIGFDPRLTALSRGPYLQTVTPSRATVRWRTGDRVGSKLIWGESPESLDRELSRSEPAIEHTLTLEGLEAGGRYCYRVVAEDRALSGAEETSCFRAQPQPGAAEKVRVWVLGDSGTGDAGARRVLQAYRNFAGDRPAEVWITLGDNAYPDGTDAQFQAAVFDTYPEELRTLALWPSLGNHDLHALEDGRGPYYDIFDLPTRGEAGGVASGTEAYYSFDHGPVHFVALDTASGDMRPGREMLTWLEADLEATTQPWVIVYAHHPPYTDGWHRSDDTEKGWRALVIRENILPILEKHGVDLFLAGH